MLIKIYLQDLWTSLHCKSRFGEGGKQKRINSLHIQYLCMFVVVSFQETLCDFQYNYLYNTTSRDMFPASSTINVLRLLYNYFHTHFPKPLYYTIKLSVGTRKSKDMWNYLFFTWQREEYIQVSIIHAVALHWNHNRLYMLITKVICDRLVLE